VVRGIANTPKAVVSSASGRCEAAQQRFAQGVWQQCI
jgi:hypothetical protein